MKIILNYLLIGTMCFCIKVTLEYFWLVNLENILLNLFFLTVAIIAFWKSRNKKITNIKNYKYGYALTGITFFVIIFSFLPKYFFTSLFRYVTVWFDFSIIDHSFLNYLKFYIKIAFMHGDTYFYCLYTWLIIKVLRFWYAKKYSKSEHSSVV